MSLNFYPDLKEYQHYILPQKKPNGTVEMLNMTQPGIAKICS